MKYPHYESYKDSGLNWLETIPANWDIKRIKYISKIFGRIGFRGYNADDLVGPGEGAITLGAGHIDKNDKIDLSSPVYLSWEKYEESPEIKVRKGDIIFGQRGSIGKVAYVDKDYGKVTINPSLILLKDIKLNPIYLTFFLQSPLIRKWVQLIGNSTAVPMISQEQFENFPCLIPTKEEQQSIANFLDKETTRLDALIAKKQQLIETLKEKRIAVISHAVTKGLNPDVPMKDSGIEWIGKIPENWNASPIKFIVSTPITDGPHTTPDFIDEGIPFISAEAIEYGGINFNKKRGFISEEDHKLFSLKYKPKLNDIYVVKSGSTTGKIAFVDTEIEFNIWSPLAAVRVKKEFSPKFVFYALSADSFQKQISLFWSFGTQPNIGMGVLQNLKIAYPDLNTQLEIVSSIDRRIEKIDITVQKTEMFVSKLQEYKTALISAAVTGKIKVPEQA
ncbi:MAG TPA: restriction endonuclease subunit S [Tenuifilaceae bacterium]|nr:restriction endonuclease subunit S [Tenuifilaceae bacterium]